MNYINPNAPAAGLTRLLNMRDNNPSTQLAYVPTKDIAAMGSMGGLEFNPYSGIPQARGIAAVAEGGSINEAPLSPVADELASRGRYGDSMLLHVRPDELQGLASLGTLTINPDTGLPEAFSFKSLLPAVGAIAGSVLLGPAFAPVFGSAFGVGIGAGLGSFAGGLAAGQKPGQAALGGLMSGATAGFMQGLAPGLEQTPGTGLDKLATTSGDIAPQLGTEFAKVSNVPFSELAASQAVVPESAIAAGTQFGQPTFQTISGKAVEEGLLTSALPATGITPQQAIDAGAIIPDMNVAQRASQVLTNPRTYVGAGLSTMLTPPPAPEFEEPEPLTFSSYTPRERTLAGGVQSPARSSEEYLRMALEGGYQPLSEQYRYAAQGGLVGLVEGGTPEQGALQSQLSPAIQQPSAPPPVLQQQEQQISERARQDELLQRDQAISRGQQFIEQPTGNQQLFQQMQSAGQVIGQQLAQGPQAYATPAGSKAPSTSFSTGADFGFNAGGLVGLEEGGKLAPRPKEKPMNVIRDLPQEESIEPYVSFLKEKEKFRAKPYIPTKGDKPTIGYGHTENVKMTDKEITEEQADLLLRNDIRKRLPQIKNKIKDFNSFPQSLKTSMVGEWFRGSLSGSPETIKLINAGEYEKASKEFLNNEEYKNAEERKRAGIKPRMKLVSNELEKLSILEDKPFSSVYSGMPDVQKETQMAKLSDTENDAGILSILRNILSGEDKQYEVQSGDTLSAIAKQQGMSLDELLEANKNISNPNVIRQGQEIAVPDQSLFLDRVRGALGYAQGGDIGQYFEGQVVGNGDGMSDQILFEVEGNNPDKALLSRDEYVIPADVVAMLGNGSSNAGSEQLDGFIKGIRQDSFGTQRQQQQLNAQQGLRGLV